MTSTDKTADELRDLASRTYRACVARQARTAKRDEEARRAHAAILARCDEVERELRELRDDHIETLAHLVACVEVLGLPRDTDGPALVEAVRARALPRAEVRAERLERHAQEAARGLVHVHIDEPVSLARGHHIDEPVRDVVERSFYNRDRAAWSERAKRAESQLALAMAWGEELADAVRCEASLRWRWEVRTDEARRALSIAETKSAGADVIVADAEARRVAAEMRAIQAEGRAERLERELAEMRADRDSWRQQAEDARSDALRYGCERDEANRERDTVLRERNTLITCARACLDPEIVSRDPAHARLAALVERIEGATANETPVPRLSEDQGEGDW